VAYEGELGKQKTEEEVHVREIHEADVGLALGLNSAQQLVVTRVKQTCSLASDPVRFKGAALLSLNSIPTPTPAAFAAALKAAGAARPVRLELKTGDFISVKPPLPKTKKEAPLPALLERAKEGDVKGVVGLLEELGGGAIDVVDRHGSNALSYAAGYGDEQQNGVEMVVLLLRHGFPVDGKDRALRQTELDPADEKSIGSVQRTPLMWACRNGKLRIARLLVRFGADCRRRTSDGTTCLHWAFWQRQIQTCRFLLGVVSWCSPRINETNSFVSVPARACAVIAKEALTPLFSFAPTPRRTALRCTSSASTGRSRA
jgi:hypothetical protein